MNVWGSPEYRPGEIIDAEEQRRVDEKAESAYSLSSVIDLHGSNTFASRVGLIQHRWGAVSLRAQVLSGSTSDPANNKYAWFEVIRSADGTVWVDADNGHEGTKDNMPLRAVGGARDLLFGETYLAYLHESGEYYITDPTTSVQMAEVTSSSTNSNGNWPAKLAFWDQKASSGSGAWVYGFTMSLKAPNGETLENGKRYQAIYESDALDGTQVWCSDRQGAGGGISGIRVAESISVWADPPGLLDKTGITEIYPAYYAPELDRSGLYLADSGGSTVVLGLHNATPTVSGTVNTTVQSFGGDKYFHGLVWVGGDSAPYFYMGNNNDVTTGRWIYRQAIANINAANESPKFSAKIQRSGVGNDFGEISFQRFLAGVNTYYDFSILGEQGTGNATNVQLDVRLGGGTTSTPDAFINLNKTSTASLKLGFTYLNSFLPYRIFANLSDSFGSFVGFDGTVPGRPICKAGWVIGTTGVVGTTAQLG
jgi:hypothetical protein